MKTDIFLVRIPNQIFRDPTAQLIELREYLDTINNSKFICIIENVESLQIEHINPNYVVLDKEVSEKILENQEKIISELQRLSNEHIFNKES